MRKTRFFRPLAVWAAIAAAFSAQAAPSLVIDIGSGEVLHQEQATQVWFPASLTKLMTAYVALKALREGRVTADTPFRVSARAARMAPSKMGFRPGTEVTLDNALKMLMVKSPNDIAVTIAEGISGSVENFATDMNASAQALGMKDSVFYNPNGLPDERQVTSARDMALLGRALFRDFPDHAGLFGIGALQLGSTIISTHNGLMGRYPGVDGMKTGFTCSAGFNVVASASRNGRHLITVVLGAPSAKDRTAKAANLFDKAFAGGSASGQIDSLPSQGGTAPNMRAEACGRRLKGGSFASEVEDFTVPLASVMQQIERMPERAFLFEAAGLLRPQPAGRGIADLARPHFDPIPVFVGRVPGWSGPVMAARGDEPTEPKAARKIISAKSGAAPVEASATAFAAQKPNPLADGGLGLKTGGAVALPMQVHVKGSKGQKIVKGQENGKSKLKLAARPVADDKAAAKPVVRPHAKSAAPAVQKPALPVGKILADP